MKLTKSLTKFFAAARGYAARVIEDGNLTHHCLYLGTGGQERWVAMPFEQEHAASIARLARLFGVAFEAVAICQILEIDATITRDGATRQTDMVFVRMTFRQRDKLYECLSVREIIRDAAGAIISLDGDLIPEKLAPTAATSSGRWSDDLLERRVPSRHAVRAATAKLQSFPGFFTSDEIAAHIAANPDATLDDLTTIAEQRLSLQQCATNVVN